MSSVCVPPRSRIRDDQTSWIGPRKGIDLKLIVGLNRVFLNVLFNFSIKLVFSDSSQIF